MVRTGIPDDELNGILISTAKMLNHAVQLSNSPLDFVDVDAFAWEGQTFDLWQHVCVVIVHFLTQADAWSPSSGGRNDGFLAYSAILSTAFMYCHLSNIKNQALLFRQMLMDIIRSVLKTGCRFRNDNNLPISTFQYDIRLGSAIVVHEIPCLGSNFGKYCDFEQPSNVVLVRSSILDPNS